MEQEMAYNASLAEDMERQRQEEEAQIEEAQRISMIDAKRSQKSSKKDSLPPEPGKGAPVFRFTFYHHSLSQHTNSLFLMAQGKHSPCYKITYGH